MTNNQLVQTFDNDIAPASLCCCGGWDTVEMQEGFFNWVDSLDLPDTIKDNSDYTGIYQ